MMRELYDYAIDILMIAFWICVVTFVALVIFVLAFVADAFGNDDLKLYPNCEGWIEKTCCCTNACCGEVTDGEVQQIGPDLYRVMATGQVLPRTGWSQNGKFMRCNCDYSPETGKWERGAKTFTRCIYPPMPNS